MQLPAPEALFKPSVTSHAYLFDLDGTLIELAERPDGVRIPHRLPTMLSSLKERTKGAVAIISGRSIDTLETLLPVPGLALAGLHGLQQQLSGYPSTGSADMRVRCIDPLRQSINAFADQNPGVLIEDKIAALAIHFRTRPNLAHAVNAFASALVEEMGENVVLISGKCVEEIRINGPDKGDALIAIMRSKAFGKRKPVYFGDDLTDEVAFKTAAQLGGTGILVGMSEKRTAALAQVGSSDDVLRFIDRLIRVPDRAATTSVRQWR
jgi:trehalose 6-phosphate phosphatase